MRQIIADQIVSSKQGSRIELVPNREILQRRIAERLAVEADGAVLVSPPIFMFSMWVEETAVRIRQLSGLDVPRSQDSFSGLLAWMRAAGSDGASAGFAFDLNAARQARTADRLLRHWGGESQRPWLDEHFYRQRQQVRAERETEGVFSAEDWLEDLTAILDGDAQLPLTLPREIALWGFVELTPLEERLLGALERRGVSVDRAESELKGADLEALAFPRPEDEWQAAASWAKTRLENGARSLCVVLGERNVATGLSSRRAWQMFSAILHPRQAASLDLPGIREFHVPAAQVLLNARVARDALSLLRLSLPGTQTKLEFSSISQWLLSPNWGDAEAERAARALFEMRLRSRGLFRLSLSDLARLARAENLDRRLPGLIEHIAALPSVLDPAEPAERFHRILLHWGWPGAATSGQVVEARSLLSCLERLAGLSLDSDGEALMLLEVMCAETALPLGGGPLSPIQILSPEVAAGGSFDGIWICHLDDAHWPPPITPNPFLPAEMRTRIPRMNPEGQYTYYRRLTAMLGSAAPEVRLSWSRDAGQGPRMASGLVSELRAREADTAPTIHLATEIWPGAGQLAGEESPALEAIGDGDGVPFPDEATVELPGGADFFRLQALCPLWAYLRHRMGVSFPAMPTALADPAFRGVLLHRALRELYANAGGTRGLPGPEVIPGAVETALSGLQVRDRFTATGLLAEEGRLKRALKDWLELDSARQGFEVDSLEEAYALALGRALLKVRVDRIDRLSDGRLFLIDYKSGKGGNSRALKWLKPRMQEPQLPLYAALLEAGKQGVCGGLALAAVKPGECGFDGISDDPGSKAKGIRVVGQDAGAVRSLDWPNLQAHWRSQAAMLCEEILAGRADNHVYDADLMRYCDVALILRHEQAVELSAGEATRVEANDGS